MTKAEEREAIKQVMAKRNAPVRKVTKESEEALLDDYTDRSMREGENRGHLDNVAYNRDLRD